MPYKLTDGAARAESCSHELCRVVTEVDHRSSAWPLATEVNEVNAEACNAITKSDFKSKSYIALKEARESLY